jgi:hypothetical protein
MLMERASEYGSLRAPAGDGQSLIDPPLDCLLEVVAQNRELLASVEYDVQGCSLAELSAGARRGLIELAIFHTRQYREVPSRWKNTADLADAPYVLSGHQPELFHPGVWFKNFVLGALARQVSGVGIHLLIDSDMCRSVAMRVPTGTTEQPHIATAAYDAPAAEMPYEERTILDAAAFSNFAKRAAALIRPLVPNPLMTELWPLVLERNPSQQNLGLRLSQGRHALEETWRNETLELPQSAVCQLPEFARFVAHVLAHLPRFWSAYNDALARYRRVHRLRNRAQPVPDLFESGGWLEAPFWIWSADDPRRRPLFARQSGDELAITDRQSTTLSLPLSADRDAAAAAAQLLDLSSRGIKLRTRALTTTLFARLVLSDLFLHGIGGAKYDQVTDEIIRTFFGVTGPAFATVSATLRLPVVAPARDAISLQQWRQQLRELRFHPERFVESNGAADLVAAKRRWVETPKSPQNAAQRHAAIVAANQALQPLVAPLREQLEQQCNEAQHRKRAEAILQSREYSFCLYPRRHFDKLIDQLPGEG